MKIAFYVLLFMLGVVSGAAGLGGFWYWQHQNTEIWSATETLESVNGIVIPAGTELVLDTWMPEGFAALELGINVEGIALEKFQRRTENKSFVRVPYFVDAGTE